MHKRIRLAPAGGDESFQAGCILACAFFHEAAERERPPRAQERLPTCPRTCNLASQTASAAGSESQTKTKYQERKKPKKSDMQGAGTSPYSQKVAPRKQATTRGGQCPIAMSNPHVPAEDPSVPATSRRIAETGYGESEKG